MSQLSVLAGGWDRKNPTFFYKLSSEKIAVDHEIVKSSLKIKNNFHMTIKHGEYEIRVRCLASLAFFILGCPRVDVINCFALCAQHLDQ